MSRLAVAIPLLLLPLAVGVRAADPHGYWLEARPSEDGEAELRDVVVRSGFSGVPAGAQGLARLSAARPGTALSGLAQLGAGLLLLDDGRPADAVPFLRHPDVLRTALADHAAMALGRALEETDVPSAAAAYLSVLDAHPDSPLGCTALFRASEILHESAPPEKTLGILSRAPDRCPAHGPRALLLTALVHEARRDVAAVVETYERILTEHPLSPEASEAARRLAPLARYRKPLTPQARLAREIKRGLALFEAHRYSDALVPLQTAKALKPQGAEADLVRVKLGRALAARRRPGDARAELSAVPADSPYAAEAAYALARLARGPARLAAFEVVATRFPGTPWGEEALVALANDYQKDARDEDALPYYRRVVDGHPEGRHVERATWRVAWGDFRAGRFEDVAQRLERWARLRPASGSTPGFLYWAARARKELKQTDRARQLLEEVRQRYKHSYYGQRSAEVLASLPPDTATPPPLLRAVPSPPAQAIPEPHLARIRQLLLLDRLDAALEELAAVPPSPAAQATVAWIEHRRGRLRPAITAMKRAYPEYAGAAGDALPPEVWRILFPLDFAGLLLQKATERGLDPALVAALVCQESTFNPGALSPAGARGLMQVIPPTGRALARVMGIPFRPQALYDPSVSLEMGTRYLRQMLDRFGGREEMALAAYNAGPHRVDAWTAARPRMSPEEFIESIPFTETRNYVKIILGNREQYRRLYSFPTTPGATAPAEASASLP